jgi:hypothetical protein
MSKRQPMAGPDGLPTFFHAEDRVRQIRELWDQRVSAAVIGKQFGMTKNAVLGLARRNSFTPRSVLKPVSEVELASILSAARDNMGCSYPDLEKITGRGRDALKRLLEEHLPAWVRANRANSGLLRKISQDRNAGRKPPKLPVPKEEPPAPKGEPPAPKEEPPAPKEEPVPPVAAADPPPAPEPIREKREATRMPGHTGCQWPGDKVDGVWTFCGKPVADATARGQARVYCREHYRMSRALRG